jgi:hypothetical protein
MSHEIECAKLTMRYLKEVEGKDLTLDEILKRPRWKRVWFWWKALEHYEGTPMPEMTLEEVKTIYGE